MLTEDVCMFGILTSHNQSCLRLSSAALLRCPSALLAVLTVGVIALHILMLLKTPQFRQ